MTNYGILTPRNTQRTGQPELAGMVVEYDPGGHNTAEWVYYRDRRFAGAVSLGEVIIPLDAERGERLWQLQDKLHRIASYLHEIQHLDEIGGLIDILDEEIANQQYRDTAE